MIKPTSKLNTALLNKIHNWIKDDEGERRKQMERENPLVYVILPDKDLEPMRYNEARKKYGELFSL